MSAPALFRARLAEIRAIDLEDGRHLLLADPPRYMPSAEFAEVYELVRERRGNARGRDRSMKKAARRTGSGRGAAIGENSKKAAAKRLFEEGRLKLKEISKRTDVPYGTLYTWVKQWKAAPENGVAQSDTRLCRECRQKTPVKGSCNHCGAKP